MLKRGCRRVRVRSKAANLAVSRCYQAAGYRPYEIAFDKVIGESKETVALTRQLR